MRVQDAHRSPAGSYGKPRTVRTVGQRSDAAIVAFERQDLLATLKVPDHDGPVDASACQSPAVRTEGEALNRLAMTSQGRTLDPRSGIPELNRPIVARAGDEKTIRTELDIMDPAPVTTKTGSLGRAIEVPQGGDAIPPGARQERA